MNEAPQQAQTIKIHIVDFDWNCQDVNIAQLVDSLPLPASGIHRNYKLNVYLTSAWEAHPEQMSTLLDWDTYDKQLSSLVDYTIPGMELPKFEVEFRWDPKDFDEKGWYLRLRTLLAETPMPIRVRFLSGFARAVVKYTGKEMFGDIIKLGTKRKATSEGAEKTSKTLVLRPSYKKRQ